jgi:hypothetical protein
VREIVFLSSTKEVFVATKLNRTEEKQWANSPSVQGLAASHDVTVRELAQKIRQLVAAEEGIRQRLGEHPLEEGARRFPKERLPLAEVAIYANRIMAPVQQKLEELRQQQLQLTLHAQPTTLEVCAAAEMLPERAVVSEEDELAKLLTSCGDLLEGLPPASDEGAISAQDMAPQSTFHAQPAPSEVFAPEMLPKGAAVPEDGEIGEDALEGLLASSEALLSGEGLSAGV